MPCFCWVGEADLAPEMIAIRNHIKEVCLLIHQMNHNGDYFQNGSPLPANLLQMTHHLLDDLYQGKCQEK